MTPTPSPNSDDSRPLPGKRTPSELKWLLNERAALAGEAQRLDVREQRLANRLRRLEPLLARTRQELAQTHQAQSETSERIASLDLTMHLMQPALNPEAGGTVKAWAGRYGERGALTEFIREVLLKSSPNYIAMVSLRDLVMSTPVTACFRWSSTEPLVWGIGGESHADNVYPLGIWGGELLRAKDLRTMARPKSKTSATTLKMTPEVRALWERCAAEEHRTLTNMFEVMVRTYAKKLRLEPDPASAPKKAA